MNRIKILFIITDLKLGGAENTLLRLSTNLDRSRFEPIVVSLKEKREIGRQIEELNIKVYSLGVKRIINLPQAIYKINKIVKNFRPHIIHSWLYHADLIGALLKLLYPKTCLFWSIRQTNLSKDLNRKSVLMLAKFCAKLSHFVPDLILTCSSKAEKSHIKYGYNKNIFHVIPNGYDLNAYKYSLVARREIRSRLNIGNDTKIVAMVARYDPQKNHTGFLLMCSYLRECFDYVTFLMIGRDVVEQNNALVEVIEKLALSDKVKLLGERSDIYRYLSAIDILVSPSHGEAFPNVIAEAMACAVPCVVTDVGESKQIVGDAGYVVEAGDTLGMADATRKLVLDDKLRSDLGKAARLRILQNYDLSKVTKDYEELYKNQRTVS